MERLLKMFALLLAVTGVVLVVLDVAAVVLVLWLFRQAATLIQ